jgi:uncharacterized membrane protein YfcA
MPSLPLNPVEIILILLVTTFGAAVQSAAGFGMGMISAPVLILIYPPLIPGPLMASSLALTALVVLRDRAHVDLRGVGLALAGRVAGVAGAAVFLVLASVRLVDLVFGTLVLLAVFLSAAGIRVDPGRIATILAGSLSGLMGTISSIGGPPMALLYQDAGGARLRGTLAGYFAVGVSLSVGALALVGRFGREELRLTLFLVSPMVLGFLIAAPVRHLLPDRAVRPLVLVLSGIAGAVVLVRSLF